jgi:hypothetical protein
MYESVRIIATVGIKYWGGVRIIAVIRMKE